MRRYAACAALIAALVPASTVHAATAGPAPTGMSRLVDAAGAEARIDVSPATGTVRLLASRTGLPGSPTKGEAAGRVIGFLTEHGPAFGLRNPGEQLQLVASRRDALGQRHLSFQQHHQGIPVFAGILRAHLDAAGDVRVLNGTLVPGLADVDPVPTLQTAEADRIARAIVRRSAGVTATAPETTESRLVVFRTNLARGLPGRNHLAWQVTVAQSPSVREMVFVDAHSGVVLDRISRAYHLQREVALRSTDNVVWSEGDPLPFTGSTTATNEAVNRLVDVAGDVHALVRNLSGGDYLSWDGQDATMTAVFLSESVDCPNALWNGRETHFCSGMASDDVAAHEWIHAITDGTHDLIYQWQPGALNESTSDIFGETVDLINGVGTDEPAMSRSSDGCSTFAGSPPPELEILTPERVGGDFAAGGAAFNPPAPWEVRGPVVRADDGIGDPWDACQDLTGFPAGSIAIIDRGSCTFRDKVSRAEAAGASAVIVVNDQGDEILEMGGDGTAAIPSIFVRATDGVRLLSALDQGLEVAIRLPASSDASFRWLIGEDTLTGGLRDMYSPSCFGDPGAVADPAYVCSEADNGGVHTNSGIPNRVFALLVDGDSAGEMPIAGIGLTRAAHIYWRAMSTYQTPTTDFTAHADVLELSCQDLEGTRLAALLPGTPSGETIDADDCLQLSRAIAAAGLRTPPTQCGFEPLLAPAVPPAGRVVLFSESFDSDPGSAWSRTNEGSYAVYDPRDWEWVQEPPVGADGGALFAVNGPRIGDCRPTSDDQSGVMHVDSPPVSLPGHEGTSTLVFDHWIATERGYDGGNVSISVNGGPFTLLPAEAFLFNPYTDTLVPRVEGNTNPLHGQPAFTGADDGSLKGSWGQSQVDLEGFAGRGDTVAFRFSLGVDGCGGLEGWYLDSVRLTFDPGPRHGGGRRRASLVTVPLKRSLTSP